MASKTITLLTDDIDGTEIPDGRGESVQFALDGSNYQIDLTAKNAAALRKALEPWVASARRVSGRRGRPSVSGSSTRRDASQTAAIREWALASGYKISSRGRIPAEIEEAYNAAP
jgi:hypothetical protein